MADHHRRVQRGTAFFATPETGYVVWAQDFVRNLLSPTDYFAISR